SGGDGGGACNFVYEIIKFGPKHAKVGDYITYRVLVKNLGDCDLRSVDVKDFLPRHVEFVSANPEPSEVDGHKLKWNDVRIAEGEKARFEIRVKVLEKD